MQKKIMFLLLVLISLLPAALALTVDVGCPASTTLAVGSEVVCTVKNPDSSKGVNLMSMTVDSVSGSASFLKMEALVGSQKLFGDIDTKEGFVGTKIKDNDLFKITLTMKEAGSFTINFKDTVVKTGDDTIFKQGESGVTFVNNVGTLATGNVGPGDTSETIGQRIDNTLSETEKTQKSWDLGLVSKIAKILKDWFGGK